MFQDKSGNCWYKVGLHIHTNLSDGALPPEEVAAVYQKAGFDAIAITDHWKYYPEGNLGGLPILSGCEYNLGGGDTAVDVMHIVGVGMKEDPKIDGTTATRQGTIDAINEAGGIAIFAHPAWSLNTLEDAKNLRGFSALEIYNSVSDVNQSSRPYSGYLVDVMANAGITYPLIATDDAHYYQGEDETKSYIMVLAKSVSREDVLSAIKKGDFYATQGPELYVKREGNKIITECSPCVMIDFLANAAWAPDKIIRNENLTYAEYPIKDFEKWVRVEVHDEKGNYAWSNIIVL